MKNFNKKKRYLFAMLLPFAVGGCFVNSNQNHALDSPYHIVHHKKLTPHLGKYKIGNPYFIQGKKYYPNVEYGYREIGIASWYGPKFHGKKTANGAIFNMEKVSAAHRTLPLPCKVRVTNLENGYSMDIIVNDRGPYAKDRIIDLSKKAARMLGFEEKGTAKVLVEILPEQSYSLMMKSTQTIITQGKKSPSSLIKKIPIVTSDLTVDYVNKYQFTYFIQIAAFQQIYNAKNLKQELAQSFNNVEISTKKQKNYTTLYLVHLGPFHYINQANQYLSKLKEKGFDQAHIVKK